MSMQFIRPLSSRSKRSRNREMHNNIRMVLYLYWQYCHPLIIPGVDVAPALERDIRRLLHTGGQLYKLGFCSMETCSRKNVVYGRRS